MLTGCLSTKKGTEKFWLKAGPKTTPSFSHSACMLADERTLTPRRASSLLELYLGKALFTIFPVKQPVASVTALEK